jgi:hypothetical protein
LIESGEFHAPLGFHINNIRKLKLIH